VRSAISLLLVAATVLHLWIGQRVFRPGAPAPNPALACISYDPRYRFGALKASELKAGIRIADEWIDADLALIAQVARCVRTYSVTDGMEKVPAVASRLGLDVVVGLDITADIGRNSQSVETAVRLSQTLTNIRSFIVGNEVHYHNMMGDHEFVDPLELYGRIADLRGRVKVPVSTAEPLPIWLEVRDLPARLDFIALNNSPYWAGISVVEAVDYLRGTTEQLKWMFPEKRVFISEVGWPAGGPMRLSAVAGRAEADQFLASFGGWARSNTIDYNYFEAFDQPWKRTQLEGRVGSQWGLFDSGGRYKLGPLGGEAHEPRLQVAGLDVAIIPWSLFSAMTGFACCLAMLLNKRWLGIGGAAYLITFGQLLVLVLAVAAHAADKEYFVQSAAFWFSVGLPMVVLTLIVLTRLLETAETLSHDAIFESPVAGPAPPEGFSSPFVSIHVPCSSEPPDMVIQTLEALLALDYPSFEIIVVDNNTLDPALYGPVAVFCAKSDRIRFFHEDVLAGYKAGALNYALDRTSPLATVIAVVDADYVVHPRWLKDLTPFLGDPHVAVVQAPQAYRQWQRSPFATMIRSEYEGFFQMAMVQRAARNAIIQHGTMLLLRRSVVDTVGRWAEWCITEDTELGLRILLGGHRAVYVPTVYGEGELPRTSMAYFKQRFRWVAGAMTILRRYRGELIGIRPGLTRAQRYHFLTGWLPWLADAVVPLFSVAAVVGVFFCLSSDLYFPPVAFAFPFMFYLFFQMVTGTVSYRSRVHVGWFNAVLASIAGMSLTWVIAIATMRGLTTRKLAFERTDKRSAVKHAGSDQGGSWPWDLLGEGYSVALACGMFACGAALLVKYGWRNTDAVVWALATWLFILPPASSALVHALSRQQGHGRRQ
jgi:cellulose synthase/poly-beta-1,6-N-acetylglucosamine synthase-like glycosyltransferase/exo-beta-1,3-glucanase (GH17 family)